MISLEDFVTAASANWRRRWRFANRFYCGLILSCAATFAFSNWFPTAVIGLWAGVLWFHWRNETPRCPHCGRNNWANSAWTIATRNCGGCGKRMLAELENSDLDADSRLRLEEFYAWWHWASRPLAARLLAWLFPNKLRDVAPDLAEAIKRGGTCPRCAMALQGITHSCIIVRITGNCGHCGEQILERVPVFPADIVSATGQLLALEDFRAACRSRLKIRMTLLPILFGVVLDGIGLGALLLFLLFGNNQIPHPAWLLVMFAPMILLGSIGGILATRIEGRDARLHCPFCQTDLAGPDLGAGVTASRRCTSCFRRIRAEPNDSMSEVLSQ
jgi:transcription elongation factor Elf1